MNDDTGRSYWERHAAKYDMTLRAIGRPLPRMLQLVSEATKGRRRILEVAAGTGWVTPTLADTGAEVVATDYAEAMVDQLRRKLTAAGISNVECRQANIYALPFEGATFDAVVAANVLHLLPDLCDALSCLTQMLRPGGVLIAPTFCHNETWRSRLASRFLAVTGFPGRRRFTLRALRAALQGAGVQTRRSEAIQGLIPIGYVEGHMPELAEP